MREIEKNFETVASVILGKPVGQLQDYEEWLLSCSPEARIVEKKSVDSGKSVYSCSAPFFLDLGDRVVRVDEALKRGQMKLGEKDVNSLSISNAPKLLSEISITTPEIVYGENFGTEECSAYGPTQQCFRTTTCWFCKHIAYSYWTRTSNNCFGCSLVTDCSFCIKCYNSTKLLRCLEVDTSNSCADCLFCHNCENLSNCMFCFNVKNLRYAVGNQVVGKEEYLRIRGILCSNILESLEKKKKFDLSIYNIGCRKN